MVLDRDDRKLGRYFFTDELSQAFKDTLTSDFNMDENGILIVDYKGHLGKQYNPGTISQYLIYTADKFLETGEIKWKEAAIKHADWLVSNAVSTDRGCVWKYNFSWTAPGYQCGKGWISGLAQGMCISGLLRAHRISGNPRYMDVSGQALVPYSVPVEEGGVLGHTIDGNPWYEEYAVGRRAQVLNGMLFATIGAQEYFLVSGDINAKKLAENGMKSVSSELGHFDLNGIFLKWSRYDNKYLFLSREYHRIHIMQLEYMSGYYTDSNVEHYLQRWRESLARYESSFVLRLATDLYSRIYLKLMNFIERHGHLR